MGQSEVIFTVKVKAGANTPSWKDSDSGVSHGQSRRNLNFPRVSLRSWHPLFLNAPVSFGLSSAHSLSALFSGSASSCGLLCSLPTLTHPHCASDCACSWKLLAARQRRAPVCLWLEASSRQMLSCFLENYFQRDCHSLSLCRLLQHHFVTAGLALGQRWKLTMGRRQEREGQVSILRAGLCPEPVLEIYWGNSSVLTTLLKNLESSVKSFDQAYSGEVSRVENY